jgi:predicted PurR-regulated permease PerM
MNSKNISINISTETIIKVVLLGLVIVFLYWVRDMIAVILFSVVIASSVEPAANWFQKRKIPRTLAVILIYLLAFMILGLVFYSVVPTIFSEFSSFSVNITSYLEKPSQISVLNDILSGLPVSMSGLFKDLSIKAANYINVFASGFFNATAQIFGSALSFILIIVLSFYLSVQKNGIENFLKLVIPIKYEVYIVDLWQRVSKKIGRWLQGQILLALLVGVLTFLGLTILNVDYSLTFALLAAVFELIPTFGPILASIPPLMISLAQSPVLALKVLILYIIVHQFENHLIFPLVVRKIVGIPPVITILALVIGAQIAGFMGLLLAVPVASVFIEILNDFDQKKRSYETETN